MLRDRRWMGAGAVLAMPIAVVFMLFTGGDAGTGQQPETLALADETTTTAPTTTTSTTTTTTTTTSTTTTTTTTTIPPDPLRTWIATAKPDVPYLVAYDQPGGEGQVIALEFLVPNPHQFGGPLTLMVTEGELGDDWVQVQLPVRPNGQTGWIDASLYDIEGTRVRAEVNLTDRTVIVWDGEDVIAETQAVVGSSTTPTPLGTFSIAAIRENPPEESYIGPYALALSAYSEVYETFSGGVPVIAIHGTSRPDQVGQARSNGCIRIPNDVVTFLAENVPLGAPVTINT